MDVMKFRLANLMKEKGQVSEAFALNQITIQLLG
jgi:hypothetical protein